MFVYALRLFILCSCCVNFHFPCQAVNKLAEVMNRKEFSKGRRSGRDKVGDLKKKEKDLRRAQQELTMVHFFVCLFY